MGRLTVNILLYSDNIFPFKLFIKENSHKIVSLYAEEFKHLIKLESLYHILLNVVIEHHKGAILACNICIIKIIF